ncbi:hypothetical protein GGR51DRAFT_536466 [Nemania sp. FL0031]|nr:hypothetical protein GGR51DRAFT_536466 [Nemania sp. FL0031]
MCRYRRSIFRCNHTLRPSEPFLTCPMQKEYLAGLVSTPCDIVDTHRCSTIRFDRMCPRCESSKRKLDKRLSDVRSRIAGLRQHMQEAYGDRLKVEEGTGEKGEHKEEVKKLDPMQEFLKSKRDEKYHMLSRH